MDGGGHHVRPRLRGHASLLQATQLILQRLHPLLVILLKLLHPGGGGVFCGDVIHHPLQICAPDWNTQFCQDPVQARATRRAVLSHCADSGALLFPTHFGAPHATAIVDTGSGFAPRWVSPGTR